MTLQIIYLPIDIAILLPSVLCGGDLRFVSIHKYQRILLSPNIPIPHEITIGLFPDSATVNSIIKNDILSHIEQSMGGYLWAPLVVAVKDIMMKRDLSNHIIQEVGDEHSFEFVEFPQRVGVAKNGAADSDIATVLSDVDALSPIDVSPARIYYSAVVNHYVMGMAHQNPINARIQNTDVTNYNIL